MLIINLILKQEEIVMDFFFPVCILSQKEKVYD